LARKKLRLLLHAESDVRIIAECTNGPETVEAIRAYRPDLLFLDVEMPEFGGFEVLQALKTEVTPWVIFTTAFDEYAVRAFEAEALDYLLKPFAEPRLREAVARARQQIALHNGIISPQHLRELLAHPPHRSGFLERLVVKSAGRVIFLNVEEIDWLEAAANYVRIHAGKECHLMRESIGRLAERLDSSRFVRVHRSVVANVSKIRELQACNSGEYILILRNGKQLPCSRGYRSALEPFISGTPSPGERSNGTSNTGK
jgi:two-component system LytT family response regulator